jgi:hypothetical protein
VRASVATAIALGSSVFGVFGGVACQGGTRDVVPETHDVVVGRGESGAGGGYSFIARRPLGFVAVASERGLGGDIAKGVADHLADALDACATNLAARGKLVDGTIRVEATVEADGSVRVDHMTVAPGDGVAANALLCVVAPLKLTTLPASGDGAAKEIIFDVSWGPAGTGKR